MTALPLFLAAALAAAPAPAAAPTADADQAAPAPAVSPEVARAGAMLEITVEKLRAGAPNYAQMEPALAESVNKNAAAMKDSLAELGALKTLDYVGPRSDAHQFKVTFEKGATTWFIALAPDGRIRTLVFRAA
jgi:hypothetical protein